MKLGKLAGVTGAALVAVASIAGCGGSDDKAATESSAATTTMSGGAWAKLQTEYSQFLSYKCNSTTGSTKAGAGEFSLCASMIKASLPSFELGVKELPSSKQKNDVLAAIPKLQASITDYETSMCQTKPEVLDCMTKPLLITMGYDLITGVVDRQVKAGA